ncbi:MAG: hypothetical protein ACKORJ_07470 [Bacteroidota bacterium]
MRLIFLFLLLIGFVATAQPVSGLVYEDRVPDELLAKKSIVLHDPGIQLKDMEVVQQGFRRCGIDAVLYFPMDIPASNDEVNLEFVKNLSARNIRFIILLSRKKDLWDLVFTAFNGTTDWFTPGQPAWHVVGASLPAIMESMLRVTMTEQKKKNLLINPVPEMELNLNPLMGNRGEYYAIDLKVDRLAIVRSGDVKEDAATEEYFKSEYPLKYQFFNKGTPEEDIRTKGFLYILKSIHTRASAGMDLLGYDMSRIGHAVTAIRFSGGPLEPVTYPAETTVWKFWFKHLENGNIYLGKGWDGEADRMQALKNHIRGLKAELKID